MKKNTEPLPPTLTAASILDKMQENQVPDASVDMEKACTNCGTMGATASGECLPCVSKRALPAEKPAEKPAAKKPEPKPHRVEVIQIRHDFTETETVALGRSLADESRVAEAIKSEAKACARQYKDKLGNSEVRIAGLVDKIKEGFEMVPVEAIVMVKIDKKEKTAKKVYYRRDTGGYIREENALNVELGLFNVLPDKHDEKKPLPAKIIQEQV